MHIVTMGSYELLVHFMTLLSMYGSCRFINDFIPCNFESAKLCFFLQAFSGIFEHLNMLLHITPDVTLAQYKETVFDVCSRKGDLLFASYPGK